MVVSGLFLDSADATFPAKDRKCVIINCNLGNFGFLAKKKHYTGSVSEHILPQIAKCISKKV